jgi:NADH dehydrogenase
MKKEKPKILVVGGGFAGVETVKELLSYRLMCDITLVSKKENFDYYPALYKMVTGALAVEVSVPLHHIFSDPKVTIKNETLVGIDLEQKTAQLGNDEVLAFDYLVLAMGSETNYFNIPGVKEHSFSFKNVEEALRLKTHFLQLLLSVKELPKEEAVKKLHTVIVGGGPSGVELAGDLTHFLRQAAQKCGVDTSLITIDLIEAAPRILAALPETASRKAEKHLRSLGVNIFLNRALGEQDIGSAAVGDITLQTSTVIWTAGTKLVEDFKLIPGVEFTEKKRVKVDATLSLPDHRNIFILGDGAGTLRSGLAQTAIYDGKYAARQIAHDLLKRPRTPYVPPKVSFVIPVGNYWALFVVGKRVFSGFFPWLLRSIIDFRYFSSILPLWYVFDVYRRGYKYRRLEKAIKACSI